MSRQILINDTISMSLILVGREKLREISYLKKRIKFDHKPNRFFPFPALTRRFLPLLSRLFLPTLRSGCIVFYCFFFPFPLPSSPYFPPYSCVHRE
mmetsp:Transcript_37863/g.42905  ORF Transcript_37863/g.42905 Transcript_37863/m.42905 type:complete len:96 (+) Transcript_37863:752-1039(+)